MQRVKNAGFVDFALVGGIAAGLFLMAGQFGLFERWAMWLDRQASMNGYQIVVAVMAVLILAGTLLWRRSWAKAVVGAWEAAAEEALADTNDRYRSLFQHNPHAVYSFDLKGTFLSANPACERMTGYSEPELMQLRFTQLIVPEEAAATKAAFKRAAAGTPQRYETVHFHRDGHRVDASVTNVPIIVGGVVVGVYGIAEDITARKELQRDLDRTSSAIAAATEGVLIVDPAQHIVFVNEARLKMHDYSDGGNLLGAPMSHLVGGVTHSEFQTVVMPSLARDGSWQGEALGRRRDGSTFPMEVSWTGLPDGYCISIARDISKRRRAEQALEDSELNYRMILEEIAEGYFEADLAGNITFANDALCTLLGSPRHEVLNLNNRDLSGPESTAKVFRHFNGVFEGGMPDPGFEWTVMRKDGAERVVSTSVALIQDSAGKVVGFRGITRDVTERTRAQEALRRSEERYRLAMRATQEVLWDSDLHTGRTAWRGAVQSMFGVPGESFENVGAWWEARLHPADRENVIGSIGTLFHSDQEMWTREYRFRREDESYVEVLARGHVVRDEDGCAVRFVGSMMDISDQKRSEAELERLAFVDPLTNLANRSRLLTELERALAEADRLGSTVAVFFLDLDRFKLINDGMGHAAGDSLLTQFGDRLRSVIRSGDVAARFAGDEFVVICRRTAQEAAMKLSDRIASTVQDPFIIQGSEIFVSVSIGIVLSTPGDSAASLLHRSDAAMYHSKADGKGTAFLFDEKMQQKALEVINTESQLSRAIERGELELYYQPVIDLSDGRPIGLEALVRWNRPEVGLVAAGEFIPIAEKSGLILRIGGWVLRESLRQGHLWRQTLPGASDLAVGVNLSAGQLQDPLLFEQVKSAIADVGIAPDAVILEITESELVGDIDGSIQVLTRLRKLGVVIAIDDFGTGYSALSYLSRIPANVVKIDRSFISPLGAEGAGRERALVAAIISMASALDLVVVAEGVETISQAVEVSSLKAGLGQGYHWCRPLPAEKMEAWLVAQYAAVVADPPRPASAPVRGRR